MLPSLALLYGHDVALLRSRVLLLRRTGLQTNTAFTPAQLQHCLATGRHALLVLRHSLTAADRDFALSLLRLLRPEMSVLDLTSDPDSTGLRPLSQVLYTTAGPAELCSSVQAHLPSIHQPRKDC